MMAEMDAQLQEMEVCLEKTEAGVWRRIPRK
jgi:hypothetical protein